jgi:AraC-type DNA-binding domain-containing proteins
MKISISNQFQIFMNKMGLNVNDILQEAGINKILWKENIDLNNSEYWRLLDVLDSKTSDQNIIYLSQIEKMNTFMPSFFAAMTAQNGLEAIKRLAEYKFLIGPVKLTIITNEKTTSVHISGIDLRLELPRFTVMLEQLLILNLLRTGTSKTIIPVKVGSKYDYGTDIIDVLKIMPEKLTENEIIFDNNDLARPFLSSNNVMWTFIRPELDRKKLEVKSGKSLEENVQALLIKRIPSGDFGIDEISKSLNISKRTLQRNLKALKTSFNEQVKYARQSLVNPLMKDETLTLIDISYLLGYSDPESFSRAFKAWYDSSPSNYRKNIIA